MQSNPDYDTRQVVPDRRGDAERERRCGECGRKLTRDGCPNCRNHRERR